jgi:hypothetical protein
MGMIRESQRVRLESAGGTLRCDALGAWQSSFDEGVRYETAM